MGRAVRDEIAPYPLFMSHGAGCMVTDVDTNEYLDLNNDQDGHAHRALAGAVVTQVWAGGALGAPSELVAKHAAVLRERAPSMEVVRYAGSSAEATLMALRTARGFTGRRLIATTEGSTHHLRHSTIYGSLADVVVLPFDDLATTTALLRRHAPNLAAAVVEPVLPESGCLSGEPDHLRELRRLTAELGILLIFDESRTFRLGPPQTTFGINPDLTVVGDSVAGGLSMGGFGGRTDVVRKYELDRPGPWQHALTDFGKLSQPSGGSLGPADLRT
ncbi:aminotransferase class III-fold pyridoxal phosphate-dependent enzyme [Kribbella sp. NPDC003505]|uniref:aminotransferase class III-fold pyridoxal phosphate-dependent enzyme n=1 Tax=Kribbella sp. NPDC003505 TaxID=3154448 RepID=UPI0033A661D9